MSDGLGQHWLYPCLVHVYTSVSSILLKTISCRYPYPRRQSDITWEAPAASVCQVSSTGRYGMYGMCIDLHFVILTSSSSFLGIWNYVSVEPSDGVTLKQPATKSFVVVFVTS